MQIHTTLALGVSKHLQHFNTPPHKIFTFYLEISFFFLLNHVFIYGLCTYARSTNRNMLGLKKGAALVLKTKPKKNPNKKTLKISKLWGVLSTGTKVKNIVILHSMFSTWRTLQLKNFSEMMNWSEKARKIQRIPVNQWLFCEEDKCSPRTYCAFSSKVFSPKEVSW